MGLESGAGRIVYKRAGRHGKNRRCQEQKQKQEEAGRTPCPARTLSTGGGIERKTAAFHPRRAGSGAVRVTGGHARAAVYAGTHPFHAGGDSVQKVVTIRR